jgi:predicted DNA-binding transcriptional regulator YafY
VKEKGTKRKQKPAGISEKVIRLLELYTVIAQKQFPSVLSLAERFQVTPRTVYRYLELINAIDPIELNHDRNGYGFLHGDRIKKLALSDQELTTLLAASSAVSHLGTVFAENFRTLVGRMFAQADKSSMEGSLPILVKTPDAVVGARSDDYLLAISSCMKEKRSVDILYLAHLAKETTRRLVDPYGLVFHEGIWILVGYCHLRKRVRNFALDRIKDLRERYLYFEAPKDFDLEEYLSRSWGIFDDQDVDVVVRFKAIIADYILRKDRWHQSERRHILPSGEVELSFTVAGIQEIKRWIYSWLPNVEVVEPPWFREQINKELQASAKSHGKE